MAVSPQTTSITKLTQQNEGFGDLSAPYFSQEQRVSKAASFIKDDTIWNDPNLPSRSLLGENGSPPFSFSRQAEDFAYSSPLDLSSHPYLPIGRKSPDKTNKLKFEKLQT